jgi:hypothetical protein
MFAEQSDDILVRKCNRDGIERSCYHEFGRAHERLFFVSYQIFSATLPLLPLPTSGSTIYRHLDDRWEYFFSLLEHTFIIGLIWCGYLGLYCIFSFWAMLSSLLYIVFKYPVLFRGSFLVLFLSFAGVWKSCIFLFLKFLNWRDCI